MLGPDGARSGGGPALDGPLQGEQPGVCGFGQPLRPVGNPGLHRIQFIARAVEQDAEVTVVHLGHHSEATAQALQDGSRLIGSPDPVALENLSNGPAVALQWSCETTLTEQHLYFAAHSIHPQHVRPGATLVLWHRLGEQQPTLTMGEPNQAVTLWYDDVLGNHYCCRYRPHGMRWEEMKRVKVKVRPSPIAPSIGL